jgi:alcohol dehydrogenase class IV
LLARVRTLLSLAGAPGSLAERGVLPEAIPTLATEASTQWTGRFNPRPIDRDDFVTLYQDALEPKA